MEIVRVRGTNTDKGSQLTATTETEAGRKSVDLVQMVRRPLLTLVKNECTSLLLFSLAQQR
jgi:hypothetical protein